MNGFKKHLMDTTSLPLDAGVLSPERALRRCSADEVFISGDVFAVSCANIDGYVPAIYVSPNGDDEFGDGSEERPFRSRSKARRSARGIVTIVGESA